MRWFYVRALFFLSLGVQISGCLGPAKINKWVSKHYDATQPPQLQRPSKTNELISITSTLVPVNERLSDTKSETTHLLPLLFYWKWDYVNTCTLNPAVPVNTFTTSFYAAAGKKGLKQKLNGRRLQLSIDQLPATFVVDDKGHAIWLIFHVIGWEALSVVPDLKDLWVSYKLLGADGVEIKNGVITVADRDRGISLKMFQSLRKKTWEYLDNYDALVAEMGQRVADEFGKEL